MSARKNAFKKIKHSVIFAFCTFGASKVYKKGQWECGLSCWNKREMKTRYFEEKTRAEVSERKEEKA